MRYSTFSLPGETRLRLGAASEDFVVDLEHAAAGKWPGAFPNSLLALIQSGPEVWRRVSDFAASALTSKPQGATFAHDKIRWHSPIPKPTKNIFCVGLNYSSHMRESAAVLDRPPQLPEVPIFFTKAPTTMNGPYDDVPWDRRATEQVDYEVELGVIIGITGKSIPRADALKHVFGYTVINDVSARDLQFKHMQWFKGKSLDGSCPMGPVVVTADEFGDPQNKIISLRVNFEQRQHATTADMIFPVEVIIESLSQGMTIESGDIIATGTPEGVGLGRKPPLYLKDGDLVETEVQGIGVLKNYVRAS